MFECCWHKFFSDKVDVKWTLRYFQETLESIDASVIIGSVHSAFLGITTIGTLGANLSQIALQAVLLFNSLYDMKVWAGGEDWSWQVKDSH